MKGSDLGCYCNLVGSKVLLEEMWFWFVFGVKVNFRVMRLIIVRFYYDVERVC